MVALVYDPESSVIDARDAYFQANSFGPNGGYDAAWVDFKLGPIPLPFPNTASRVAAVKVHDLHHIVTGYDTDLAGELEIAAWEIGAGCGRFAAAWVLNLSGLAFGALVWPRRVFRAFVRGRRSRSLYGRSLDALLAASVGDLRRATGIDRAGDGPGLADAALYALAYLAGAVVGVAFLAVALPLVPFGVVALATMRPKAVA